MHTFFKDKKQTCSLKKKKVKQQHSDIDEHPQPGAEYLTAAWFLSWKLEKKKSLRRKQNQVLWLISGNREVEVKS